MQQKSSRGRGHSRSSGTCAQLRCAGSWGTGGTGGERSIGRHSGVPELSPLLSCRLCVCWAAAAGGGGSGVPRGAHSGRPGGRQGAFAAGPWGWLARRRRWAQWASAAALGSPLHRSSRLLPGSSHSCCGTWRGGENDSFGGRPCPGKKYFQAMAASWPCRLLPAAPERTLPSEARSSACAPADALLPTPCARPPAPTLAVPF